MADSKKKRSKVKEEKASSDKRSSGAKKKKGGLTSAQRETLLALDASCEASIDHPVVDTLQEARELSAAERKLGKALYKKSKLTRAVGKSLPDRRALLEAAEAAWTDARTRGLTSDLREARKEAEGLKRDALAALRHFLEDDEAVQKRVDAIVPGTGVAGLVDDLQRLAGLMDEQGAALAKAELPKDAPTQARALAEQLGTGTAERAVDPERQEAQALRNRAFWWLREAMDEIRSAGRYVYRDDPKLLALFRASSTRARARQRRGAQEGAEAPAERSAKPEVEAPAEEVSERSEPTEQ
jgi:hypothetical protein